MIEKSVRKARKAYVDIYELMVKYGSVKASNIKHKSLLTGTSGVGTYQTGWTSWKYAHTQNNDLFCCTQWNIWWI